MKIKAAIPAESRQGFIGDLPGVPVTDTDGNQVGQVVEAHYIAGNGEGVIELTLDVLAGSIEVDGLRPNPDTFTATSEGVQVYGTNQTGGSWPQTGATGG